MAMQVQGQGRIQEFEKQAYEALTFKGSLPSV